MLLHLYFFLIVFFRIFIPRNQLVGSVNLGSCTFFYPKTSCLFCSSSASLFQWHCCLRYPPLSSMKLLFPYISPSSLNYEACEFAKHQWTTFWISPIRVELCGAAFLSLSVGWFGWKGMLVFDRGRVENDKLPESAFSLLYKWTSHLPKFRGVKFHSSVLLEM